MRRILNRHKSAVVLWHHDQQAVGFVDIAVDGFAAIAADNDGVFERGICGG